MNQRLSYALSVVAAVAIGGGGLYVLLDKAAPIVEQRPQPASRIAAPPPPTYEPSPVPQDRPSGSAIYRCDRGGSVVYSDTPCQGGRVVDVHVTQGFEPQRAPQSSTRSQTSQQAPAPPRTPAIAQANGSAEEALCAQIDRAIESIDAAARRGGTIQYMEDLKERRRKLVEKRQELRC